MKKILISLTILAVVGGVVGFGTVAFFNDTETSKGNMFQTGAIDLLVDSKCTYNGNVDGQCGAWNPVDLTNEKFFNFTDLKPGDYGENTISLHVNNNPAKACVIVKNMYDDDPSITEPEKEVGDNTIGNDQGELKNELQVFVWDDNGSGNPCNNVWNKDEEPLIQGKFGDVINGVAYQLPYDLPAEETKCLGVYWCYGEMKVDEPTNSLLCSGKNVSNLTQTDTLTADVEFYVEQARHNESFACPTVASPPPRPTPKL